MKLSIWTMLIAGSLLSVPTTQAGQRRHQCHCECGRHDCGPHQRVADVTAVDGQDAAEPVEPAGSKHPSKAKGANPGESPYKRLNFARVIRPPRATPTGLVQLDEYRPRSGRPQSAALTTASSFDRAPSLPSRCRTWLRTVA